MNILYFTLSLLFTGASGIFVAEFQGDGRFSTEAYMNYTESLECDLTDFTLCLRLKIHFLRGKESYVLSYSDEITDNALNVKVYVSEQKDTKEIIVDKNEFGIPQVGPRQMLTMLLEQHQTRGWHHVCFTIANVQDGDNQYISTSKLYFDGSLVNTGEVKTQKLVTLSSKGSMILGQESDQKLYGGMFNPTQGFSGMLTQVEMWNIALDGVDVKKLANYEEWTVKEENKVLEWSTPKWVFHQILFRDVDYDYFRKEDLILDKVIWLKQYYHPDIVAMSLRLNGRILQIPDQSNITEVVSQTKLIFQAYENLDGCFPILDVWTSLVRVANSSKWIDVYETDMEPVACIQIKGETLLEKECLNNKGCSTIQLPEGHTLYLKGLCQSDIKDFFDFEYHIDSIKNGKPHIKGLMKSHIFFNESSSKWVLQSFVNPNKVLTTIKTLPNNLPYGRMQWTYQFDNEVCQLKNGDDLELTLSACYPNKFTCDSGHCIDIEDRCNYFFDCEDESDEQNCNTLDWSATYSKSILPKQGKEPVKVYIEVEILNLPSVDTVELKFTCDFYLLLFWYDYRLTFLDLNKDQALNQMSSEDIHAIWTPHLSFANALGSFDTVVDEKTGATVRREENIDKDKKLQNYKSIETQSFQGDKNPIRFARRYYLEYSCQFDLQYYPFDTQMCDVTFEVKGLTDKHIELVAHQEGAKMLGFRDLVEYRILNVTMKTFINSHNYSSASVTITFQRKLHYHVGNTFLQTFMIMMIGYLSLFFDIENFTDRIMASLTTLLVVATLISSIQASLPKTSYYKLIDWWLIMLLNILVLILIYHTYLAFLLRKKTAIGSIFTISGTFDSGMTQVNDCVGKSSNSTIIKAKRVNGYAKIMFTFLIVLFNIIFWIIAIVHHVK